MNNPPSDYEESLQVITNFVICKMYRDTITDHSRWSTQGISGILEKVLGITSEEAEFLAARVRERFPAMPNGQDLQVALSAIGDVHHARLDICPGSGRIICDFSFFDQIFNIAGCPVCGHNISIAATGNAFDGTYAVLFRHTLNGVEA